MLTILDSPRNICDFLSYDLEWIPGELTVRLVGVYDGHRYSCYSSVEDFIDGQFTSVNRGKWFYAHAGGLADVQFVLDALVRANDIGRKHFRVDCAFSGSSAIIVHVRLGHNVWHLIDSYWLLRDKLANIGKAIGIGKAEPWGFDADEEGLPEEEWQRRQDIRREWYRTAPFMELREYNEVDCRILWKAIHEFEIALLELGGELRMTLASCAMNLFRRKYLKRSIDTNAAVNESSRKSYVASRVEVFWREVRGSNYYDINSSFPYSMTMPCPGEFLGTLPGLPDDEDSIYTADVTVTVPEMALPPIPYRAQGRIFFPIGRWRGWLTSVDVRLLEREGGRINKVHEVLQFESRLELAGYAQDIYAKRKASKTEFEKLVYKLLLNSLYGKFAESAEKTSLSINPPNIRPRMHLLFPGAWLETKIVPVAHMHVPIAAHITALARRTLYDSMSICRDFHYCDTDGFSTTETLNTSKELGGLKHEKILDYAHFVTQKVYKMVGKTLQHDGSWKSGVTVKAKGFSRMTVGRLQQLIEGEQIHFERMARIRELYRSGVSKPSENTYSKQIRIRSVLDRDFDPRKHAISKRFAYPDGSTRPWHLDELNSILGG